MYNLVKLNGEGWSWRRGGGCLNIYACYMYGWMNKGRRWTCRVRKESDNRGNTMGKLITKRTLERNEKVRTDEDRRLQRHCTKKKVFVLTIHTFCLLACMIILNT